MYLSHLLLQNFRIFSNCKIKFLPGVNLLAGENDAGKTAIVEAIKMILGTISNDWLKIEDSDFHNKSDFFTIACGFKDLTQEEAAGFLEWLSFGEDGNYYLKITMRARRVNESKYSYTIYAGADEDSGSVQGDARERLKVTYLKALRDAEFELTPKRNSRFSQILDSYEIFQNKDGHPLVEIMKKANDEVKNYFSDKGEGAVIQKIISDDYLKNFSLAHNPLQSKIDISNNKLKSILEKLELGILNQSLNENLGLGSNNLLFIAAELLLLKKDNNYSGLKLALIEEIEAHLHPQSQLNLINFLEKESLNLGFQSIITTHSNILASKISIENVIICKAGNAFSLSRDYTKLAAGDYQFLRRFLDATKSNLFFANAVMMVEGDAENLLLPSLADLLGKPLFKYGVSIVNVSSTALLRYSRIFQRKDGKLIGIPVACITDRDIPPKEAGEYTYVLESGKNKGQQRNLVNRRTEGEIDIEEQAQKDYDIYNKYTGGDVKVFWTENWTLEYELALSCLKEYLYRAVNHALKSKDLEVIIDDIELEKIYKKSDDEIESWIKSNESLEEIAVRIYAPLVRKQASKAVVAQILAMLIDENPKQISSCQIRKDKALRYLVRAIDYVTDQKEL